MRRDRRLLAAIACFAGIGGILWYYHRLQASWAKAMIANDMAALRSEFGISPPDNCIADCIPLNFPQAEPLEIAGSLLLGLAMILVVWSWWDPRS